jgi:hypothetical protein
MLGLAGVLEYWRAGIIPKLQDSNTSTLPPSNTPILQYSSTPMQ